MKFKKKNNTEALIEKALNGKHKKFLMKQIKNISGLDLSEEQFENLLSDTITEMKGELKSET